MLDWLLDPFSGGIMRRALAEVVLLSLACGPLGVWILLYRHSYAAESISHGMLPGLVVAALTGAPLLLGAAGGVVVAAIAIALAAGDERLGPDVGVAVAIGTLTGAGALLALAPTAPPRVAELLFGDPLGISPAALAASTALAAGVVAGLAVAHRRLAIGAFDPIAATSLGSSPRRSELVLLLALAAGTVAAVQALGNLLTLALLLAPAAAALRMRRSLRATLMLAVLVCALSGAGGLLLSYHLDVATGAAIALCAVGAWALSRPVARLI